MPLPVLQNLVKMKKHQIKVDLKKKEVNSKFKFTYTFPDTPTKVIPTCGCTSYEINNNAVTFTVSTPTHIPFQIKTDTWQKHVNPIVKLQNEDIYHLEIKYYLEPNYD